MAKELGRRWADMAPEVKQRKWDKLVEDNRLKYNKEMAAYRQGNYVNPNEPVMEV